jgi:hypothetical protein
MQQTFLNELENKIINKIGTTKQPLVTATLHNRSFLKVDPFRQIRGHSAIDRFSFIDIIRGLVPKSIKRILTKLIHDKEDIKTIIKSLFKDLITQKWQKWLERCAKFLQWEKENNITTTEKKKKYKKRGHSNNRPYGYNSIKKQLNETEYQLNNIMTDKILTEGYALHDIFYNIDECGVLTSSE